MRFRVREINRFMIITEISNLKKTIVRGRKDSVATLYHIKENDQKIIDNITGPYVMVNFFNPVLLAVFRCANLYHIFQFIQPEVKKNQ